jgi:hypothetical protein
MQHVSLSLSVSLNPCFWDTANLFREAHCVSQRLKQRRKVGSRGPKPKDLRIQKRAGALVSERSVVKAQQRPEPGCVTITPSLQELTLWHNVTPRASSAASSARSDLTGDTTASGSEDELKFTALHASYHSRRSTEAETGASVYLLENVVHVGPAQFPHKARRMTHQELFAALGGIHLVPVVACAETAATPDNARDTREIGKVLPPTYSKWQ